MRQLKRLLVHILSVKLSGQYRFIQLRNSFIVWMSGDPPSFISIVVFLIKRINSLGTRSSLKDKSTYNIFEISRVLAELDRNNLSLIALLSKGSKTIESALVFQQTLFYQANFLPMIYHLKSEASDKNIAIILHNSQVSTESTNWIKENLGIEITNHISDLPLPPKSPEAEITYLQESNQRSSKSIVIVAGRIKDINNVLENINPSSSIIVILKPGSKISNKDIVGISNLHAILRLPSLEILGHNTALLKLIIWKDIILRAFQNLMPVSDVYGPLERSPLAAVFTILNDESNFKIHNFQHGLLPKPYNLELIKIDTFYYLYDEAKDYLSSELKDCVLIKQNSVAIPLNKGTPSSSLRIIFFNQPIKGIFCTREEMIKTYKLLDDICRHSPSKIELSIKQHPSEKKLARDLIQLGENYGDVNFFSPSEDSLPLIKGGDIIITHSSSILLDALNYRKTTLLTCNAFTFNSLFSSLKSDYIHPVQDYNQFIELLSEINCEQDRPK